MPFQDNSFDKVILTCVLPHVERVQKTLEELRRVARPGGKLILYLPCDPGWLYRTGRWLIPRLTAKRYGIDAVKDFCDALDHRNAFLNMHHQALWAFRNDSLRYIRRPFPFNKLWWQLQAFQINEITIQK